MNWWVTISLDVVICGGWWWTIWQWRKSMRQTEKLLDNTAQHCLRAGVIAGKASPDSPTEDLVGMLLDDRALVQASVKSSLDSKEGRKWLKRNRRG